MEQRTFEGTWEEITRRAAELAGRKVRLTVIDEPPSPGTLDSAVAPLIEAAEHLVASLPQSTGTPLSADDWSDGVTEKYRRQGFKL
jgi:hypothetical protein